MYTILLLHCYTTTNWRSTPNTRCVQSTPTLRLSATFYYHPFSPFFHSHLSPSPISISASLFTLPLPLYFYSSYSLLSQILCTITITILLDRHLQRIRNVPSPLCSAIHRACVCLRFAPRHHHLWLALLSLSARVPGFSSLCDFTLINNKLVHSHLTTSHLNNSHLPPPSPLNYLSSLRNGHSRCYCYQPRYQPNLRLRPPFSYQLFHYYSLK